VVRLWLGWGCKAGATMHTLARRTRGAIASGAQFIGGQDRDWKLTAIRSGSVGDSSDNALAESIIGLYKTEVIHHSGPWRNFEYVEFETLKWVDWFNNQRLLEPIGDIPPAEFEVLHSEKQEAPATVAGLKQ